MTVLLLQIIPCNLIIIDSQEFFSFWSKSPHFLRFFSSLLFSSHSPHFLLKFLLHSSFSPQIAPLLLIFPSNCSFTPHFLLKFLLYSSFSPRCLYFSGNNIQTCHTTCEHVDRVRLPNVSRVRCKVLASPVV